MRNLDMSFRELGTSGKGRPYDGLARGILGATSQLRNMAIESSLTVPLRALSYRVIGRFDRFSFVGSCGTKPLSSKTMQCRLRVLVPLSLHCIYY